MRAGVLTAGAAALSVLLVVIYLAAGGSSYEPTPVADPCAERAWTSPDNLEEDAQQFLLSALDGAACDLGVSREELAVALATDESRAQFAAAHDIDDAELEASVRAGLARAIDDAENAGALSPIVADGLRALAQRVPVDEAIGLIRDGSAVFSDAQGLIGRLGGLLDSVGGVIP